MNSPDETRYLAKSYRIDNEIIFGFVFLVFFWFFFCSYGECLDLSDRAFLEHISISNNFI